MSALTVYCRFCANEKPQKSLINLKKSNKLQISVKQKMCIFSEEIVDFTNKNLPESMCTACYSSLNKSYEFFMQAKESQVVLSIVINDQQNREEKSASEPMKQELDSLALDSWLDRVTESDVADDSWSTYSWRCSYCEIILPSMQELRTHTQDCHGTCCGFRCDDCNEPTVGFDKFIEHVREHRPSLRNYCQYCNIKIETPAHIDTHMYNCNSCGQPFILKKHLLAHLQTFKPIMRDNSEPTNFIFQKQAEIPTIRTHKPMDKLKDDPFDNDLTEICDTFFSDNETSNDMSINNDSTDCNKPKLTNEIKEENITQSTPKIKKWSDYPCICKFCGLKAANWGILKIHSISHHQKCFGMKCIDCELDFCYTWEEFALHVIEHRPNLINHCHYCHSEISELDQSEHFLTHKARFQCSACGQHFKNMRDFRCHDNKLIPRLLKPPNKRRRTPIKDEEIICNICSFRAKSPWFLKKHKLIHSERKREFTCDRCGKAFMSKGTLDWHSRLHELHEDDPKEVCKVCGKAFFTIKQLRDHVKNHNLVLPFQCDGCKKFFRSKDSLRAHVVVHMDIKPFTCQYCPKKFRTKKSMRNHEYQHTGARPFSCDICCLNFSCWSNCDKHLRRMHGTSLAKAIVTPYGRLEIDPSTGKPRELSITSDLKEWTKTIIEAKRGRKRKAAEQPVDTSKLSES